MKRAAFSPRQLALGVVAGTVCLGVAIPALAHGGECPEGPSRMMRGGGGGMRGEACPQHCPMHARHKHVNLVVQPYWNMEQDNVFTLFGMEMLKQDARGWKMGFGCYGGMDFGVTTQTNTFRYGGAILGKDFTAGPVSLTTGVLLGFGKTANILPNVLPDGIRDFYMFGVGAPRVGLAFTLNNHVELGLEASYLFTTNPNIGHNPAVSLRLSHIRWGKGYHHGH